MSPRHQEIAWILVSLTRTPPDWMAYQNRCVAFAELDGDVIFSAPCAEISPVTYKIGLSPTSAHS